MAHYTFPAEFRAHYDHAVALYAQGRREAATFFDSKQSAWLDANGLSAQALYDYAEDENNSGTPGFAHALTIEAVRRDYFLNVQGGRASDIVADSDRWPAKDAAVNGITWLPRILPKVRAKLRGELPASMMYCCGGDRRFFQQHDILPAEFLSLAWRHENDAAAIIAWVTARARKSTTAKPAFVRECIHPPRWSALTPMRWISAATTQRVEVNAFHPPQTKSRHHLPYQYRQTKSSG